MKMLKALRQWLAAWALILRFPLLDFFCAVLSPIDMIISSSKRSQLVPLGPVSAQTDSPEHLPLSLSVFMCFINISTPPPMPSGGISKKKNNILSPALSQLFISWTFWKFRFSI